MYYPNSLAAQRKRWALTQGEVGALLGVSADAVGTYERGERAHALATSIALELLFGSPVTGLFPEALVSIAYRVAERLAAWSIEVERTDHEHAPLKQRFIAAVGERLIHFTPDV